MLVGWRPLLEAIVSRLKAIATRVEAIASRLEMLLKTIECFWTFLHSGCGGWILRCRQSNDRVRSVEQL